MAMTDGVLDIGQPLIGIIDAEVSKLEQVALLDWIEDQLEALQAVAEETDVESKEATDDD